MTLGNRRPNSTPRGDDSMCLDKELKEECHKECCNAKWIRCFG